MSVPLWIAEMATLILDKRERKSKAVTRDKEEHYMIIKGSIH